MSELWYYADGEETRGPISVADLVGLLSKLPDPRNVMIWRHGFEDWKPTDEVPEIARQVVRPPPLRSNAPPPREPAVSVADAAEFTHVKPMPNGLGGWLALLTFGEITGLARFLVSMGEYYSKIDGSLWSRFPTTLWGEVAMNGAVLWLNVYTIVLLFRRSRYFPQFLVYQFASVICMPFVALLWAAGDVPVAVEIVK